jgi:hypothetical protein
LESTNGLQIPLKRIQQKRNDHIYKGNYWWIQVYTVRSFFQKENLLKTWMGRLY